MSAVSATQPVMSQGARSSRAPLRSGDSRCPPLRAVAVPSKGIALGAMSGAFGRTSFLARETRNRAISVETVIAPGSGDPDKPAGADLARHSGAEVDGEEPMYVRFDDKWYDLTAWRAAHPAGVQWIDAFKGRDATDVFYAFHSDDAQKMLRRLPTAAEGAGPREMPPDPTSIQRNFRELRQQLLDDGWFERDPLMEAAHLAGWAACVGMGLYCVHGGGPAWLSSLAAIPFGLSFVNAGWLAHDYIHGRGKWCSAMRHFGGWAAGFSATMWSDKHNMHHALTNHKDHDEDLSSGPVLFLWAPDPSKDKPWRPFQHIYAAFAFTLLHVVWRVDSISVVKDRGLKDEGIPLAFHYALCLAAMPLGTFAGAVLIAGFIMSNVTSTSHQSEVLYDEYEHDWIRVQFETTRDAVTTNPFTEWLWGGMQYQLEHHLFPTMPRYRYPKLIPIMKQFAEDNGLEYREAGEWKMVTQNYANYKRVAGEGAQEGASLGKAGVNM